ncbi:MAG: radical SAM protein [Alphaproteobacteria bacterium]|nr:MAG: radical SAM protein [Alphaproteobacteria bacterium]
MSDHGGREHRETFQLFLIKPSHYDDDGYVIQWVRSDIPSNTMAVLNGLTLDCLARRVLGENVDIEITACDETNTRIKTKKIIRKIEASGGKGLVALIGVQSNQFPRAVDIARPLRAAGISVCIGGFHTSGTLAMLPEVPAEIQEAWKLGISIFAGEAEGRLDDVLKDAYHNKLKPLYNFLSDLPGLEGAPTPILPSNIIKRNLKARTSIDCGRGCPFQCSFCTIINVQGRKSRYRSADDIEITLRENHAQGITSLFITDDNFARNKNWEAIFDRIIKLREEEDMKFDFIIQVDTLCHLIPNFVEKSGRVGVKRVFIGLENINPDNLIGAKKKQNRITEYRAMLQAWKHIGAITYCGYIIGFPNDTPERILHDIEIIKRELPIDVIEFFCLTPLPGSEDHKILDAKGVWMDPDLNKYDVEHVCTDHPLMSKEEFQNIYRQAWHAFFTDSHVETIMRRAVASGGDSGKIMKQALWFYGCQTIEGVHPLQGGLFRRRYRTDRRPGMPIESMFTFYPRYLRDIVHKHARFLALAWKYARIRSRVEKDPLKHDYMDLALTPASDQDLDNLLIFKATESAKAATEKVQLRRAKRAEKMAAG